MKQEMKLEEKKRRRQYLFQKGFPIEKGHPKRETGVSGAPFRKGKMN